MEKTLERERILRLFQPFDNKKFPVKNRFVRAATWLGACDAESGALTPEAVRRQAETAAGGAGTVISEFAYVSPEGKAATRQWGLDGERAVGEVRALARAIHDSGSKLVVQLCHAGAARHSSYAKGLPGLSPSGIRLPQSDSGSPQMTEEDIAEVCRRFAAAAKRVKEGGADGVEIHGAHGYLFTQFLSPLFNRREDRYGGSLENRMRPLRECYAAVREAVGADFPVWLKISAEEGVEGGYGADEGIEAAVTLLRDGVDAVEVSSGTGYSGSAHTPSMVGISAGESEAPFAPYARRIKADAPEGAIVALTGGLRSLQVISSLLYDGTADLFGLCRPFNAEPDLINRWAEDDARPSACISCNACFRTAANGIVDCPIMRDRQEGEWDPL
ncbi:MAG: NADH:flavin oxidoreductase [Synergistaceae bacterium]|nr:NADH:flavin oxidoreductase [Synergistaceae bacterium]